MVVRNLTLRLVHVVDKPYIVIYIDGGDKPYTEACSSHTEACSVFLYGQSLKMMKEEDLIQFGYFDRKIFMRRFGIYVSSSWDVLLVVWQGVL